MGCSNSTEYAGEIKKEWLDVFYAMKLTRPEVVKMYEIYLQVDTDKSGSIDVVELLTLLDVERTVFTERIFSAFDKDHTGKIDFYEFVVSLWKFCTLGDGAIAVFAFDIYDCDADGIMSQYEAAKLFSELGGGANSENEKTKAALLALGDKTEHNTILIEDFRTFCRTHQALLAPVFAAQQRMRTTAMGCSFWDNMSRRRIELRKGYNVPLSELMVLHSDRSLFRSLLEDQTIMCLSKMMKTVLENTDNAAHYVVEVKHRRKSMTDRIKDHIIGVGQTMGNMGSSFKRGSKRGGNSPHHKKKVAPSPSPRNSDAGTTSAHSAGTKRHSHHSQQSQHSQHSHSQHSQH